MTENNDNVGSLEGAVPIIAGAGFLMVALTAVAGIFAARAILKGLAKKR